jgi:hypothetical protein
MAAQFSNSLLCCCMERPQLQGWLGSSQIPNIELLGLWRLNDCADEFLHGAVA